jgi:hypothetical protein
MISRKAAKNAKKTKRDFFAAFAPLRENFVSQLFRERWPARSLALLFGVLLVCLADDGANFREAVAAFQRGDFCCRRTESAGCTANPAE